METLNLAYYSKEPVALRAAQNLARNAGAKAPTAPDEQARDAVVIIEPRLLIRECLARALSSLGGGPVHAFADVEEWMASEVVGGSGAIVLFSMGRKGRTPAQNEQELAILHQAGPAQQVVLVSENEEVARILEALDNGAKGYIPMSVSLKVAVEAIRLVRAGGIFVPASSLIASRRSIEEAAAPRLRCNGLFTERQVAVVQAVRQGKANKIIAHELNMRESTVKAHIRNVMKKLKARNRTEVAYLAQKLIAE
ncbi:LuxR C-terminal-related transcriptional regulator [Arenibaculum pallidiluteum]|uniref:LuxR C-terminal-related transcriptional regulator n=1 Tax=Arenibaculum pallidiluteum TaxID=2812559 RepID=UPI001A9660BB|nr:response regulator transcription factor [Arenibaculum pallidiluteum]